MKSTVILKWRGEVERPMDRISARTEGKETNCTGSKSAAIWTHVPASVGKEKDVVGKKGPELYILLISSH